MSSKQAKKKTNQSYIRIFVEVALLTESFLEMQQKIMLSMELIFLKEPNSILTLAHFISTPSSGRILNSLFLKDLHLAVNIKAMKVSLICHLVMVLDNVLV